MSKVRKKPSRAEANRKARRVLAKHGVDMSRLQVTTTPRSISLSGVLLRPDGSEFPTPVISTLADNLLQECGRITTNLSNWDLTGGSVIKLESESNSSGTDES